MRPQRRFGHCWVCVVLLWLTGCAGLPVASDAPSPMVRAEALVADFLRFNPAARDTLQAASDRGHQAEEMLLQAVLALPNDSSPNSPRTALSQGRAAAAIDYFRQRVDSDAAAARHQGALLLGIDAVGAEAAFLLAVQAQPDQPLGWLGLGRARLENRNPSGAAEAFERVADWATLRGDDRLGGWAALFTGDVQWWREDLAAAAQSMRHAADLFDRARERWGQGRALIHLSVLLGLQQDYDAAADIIRDELLATGLVNGLYSESRLFERLGQLIQSGARGTQEDVYLAFDRALTGFRYLGNQRAELRVGEQQEEALTAYIQSDHDALLQRARSGEPALFIRLALAYNGGLGVPRDVQKSADLLLEGSNAGDLYASFLLGSLQLVGDAEQQAAGVALLYKTAHQSSLQAQLALAEYYFTNGQTPLDPQQLTTWLKSAATDGNLAAQRYLMGLYQGGRWLEEDPQQGFYWSLLAARQGWAMAQYQVGWHYANGVGVAQDKPRAWKWITLAAEQKFGAAENWLGLLTMTGEGRPRDPQAARRWYTRAVEHGHMQAAFNLGHIYLVGSGTPIDGAQSRKWFQLAAQAGDAESQYFLGMLYTGELGQIPDIGKAIHWFERAARQGEPFSQMQLAQLYQGRGDIPPDPEKRAYWLGEAAAGGQPWAQSQLASLYVGGDGVAQDMERAEYWYRKAAAQNDHFSAMQLGLIYQSRGSSSQDLKTAAGFFAVAAAGGDAQSQYFLGQMTLYGRGIARDVPAGLALLQQAVDGGVAQADFELGQYYRGLAQPQDMERARLHYARGAEAGDAKSQNGIATFLNYGEGGRKNLPESVFWYRKSAEQGYVWAAMNLAHLYEHGEGIEADLALARQWYQQAVEQSTDLDVTHFSTMGLRRLALSERGLALDNGLDLPAPLLAAMQAGDGSAGLDLGALMVDRPDTLPFAPPWFYRAGLAYLAARPPLREQAQTALEMLRQSAGPAGLQKTLDALLRYHVTVHRWHNDALGLSVYYPDSWQVEALADNGVRVDVPGSEQGAVQCVIQVLKNSHAVGRPLQDALTDYPWAEWMASVVSEPENIVPETDDFTRIGGRDGVARTLRLPHPVDGRAALRFLGATFAGGNEYRFECSVPESEQGVSQGYRLVPIVNAFVIRP